MCLFAEVFELQVSSRSQIIERKRKKTNSLKKQLGLFVCLFFILIIHLGLYNTFIPRALYGDMKSNSIFWVCAGMKSCAVTFQSKILYQHFHMVLFTTQQALTLDSVQRAKKVW